MDPTQAQPQAVTVLQPPLNLRITRNYGNNAVRHIEHARLRDARQARAPATRAPSRRVHAAPTWTGRARSAPGARSPPAPARPTGSPQHGRRPSTRGCRSASTRSASATRRPARTSTRRSRTTTPVANGGHRDHDQRLRRWSSARAAVMNRLREQDGMTLPEVLVAITIAMIISLATFALDRDRDAPRRRHRRARRHHPARPLGDGLHHPPAALAGVREARPLRR